MSPFKARKTFMISCSGIALATMLSACGGGGAAPAPAAPAAKAVSFTSDIKPIFQTICNKCHTAGGLASFLVLDVDAFNDLVERPATQSAGTLVIAGDSKDSILYQRISGIGLQPSLLPMPLGGPSLTADQQNLVKAWIDEGARNN